MAEAFPWEMIMMRTKITLTVVLLFFVAGPLSVPAGGEEAPAGAPKAAHDKVQYEKNMRERLDKLGAKFDELKRTVDARSVKVEAKMKEHLAEAEKKRQAAALKLEELGKASTRSWKKVSAEMDKAAKDFERAFERARKRLR
jgi:hypothetical protein